MNGVPTNEAFWSTMAEVSATFAALVFAGLVFYLGSIRDAVSKAEAELGAEEQSSRVMVISVLSNLSFFVLPLIASLSLIAQDESTGDMSSIFWLDVAVCLVLVGVLAWGRLHDRVRKQLKDVRQKTLTMKLLVWRLGVGWIPLALFILAHIVPLGAILKWERLAVVLGGEPFDLLKVVTFLSILLGLTCGIIDLVLFDTDNVLFKASARVQERLERMQDDLRAYVQGVGKHLRDYQDIVQSGKYKEYLEEMKRNAGAMMLDPDRIQTQAEAEQAEIRAAYADIRKRVPEDREAKLITEFRELGEAVTYGSLKRLRMQYELLLRDIKSLGALLRGKLDSFEERGLSANSD